MSDEPKLVPGVRVVALRDADDDVVNIFGHGVYVGEGTPPNFPLPINNPKIELDDGNVVWGYQCWWGPEEWFDGWLEKRTVNIVPVPDPETPHAR